MTTHGPAQRPQDVPQTIGAPVSRRWWEKATRPHEHTPYQHLIVTGGDLRETATRAFLQQSQAAGGALCDIARYADLHGPRSDRSAELVVDLSTRFAVAPSADGLHHYLINRGLYLRTVCANLVTELSGELVFRPMVQAFVDGVRTAVTSVIMPAHAMIGSPYAGQLRCLGPREALEDLRACNPGVDAWFVLTTGSAWDAGQIARWCPWVTGIPYPGGAPYAAGSTPISLMRVDGLTLAEPASAGGWSATSVTPLTPLPVAAHCRPLPAAAAHAATTQPRPEGDHDV